jgi:hypothetical protein
MLFIVLIREHRRVCMWRTKGEPSVPLVRGWCLERSELALDAISKLGDLIRQLDVPREKQRDLEDEMRNALVNVSKIFAFGCGEEWWPTASETILREGYDGFLKVARSYEASIAAAQHRTQLAWAKREEK